MQKEGVVIKNQVILNSIQDLQRRLLLLVNGKRGRFQIKFGMTSLYNSGFTLIELLVVVLIIGILAAVAVPQYQKAITKSRIADIASRIATHKRAMDLFYLNNGNFNCVSENGPTVQSTLAITPFKECTYRSSYGFTCPHFDIDANFSCKGEIYLYFCPGDTTKNHTSCKQNSQNTVRLSASSYVNKTLTCSGNTTNCQLFLNMLK